MAAAGESPSTGKGIRAKPSARLCHLALQQRCLETWHIHVTSVGRSCVVSLTVCQRKPQVCFVIVFVLLLKRKKKTTCKKYSLRCKDACTLYCLGHPCTRHPRVPRRVRFQWQQDTLCVAGTSTVPVQPGESSLSAPVTNPSLYSPQLLRSVVVCIRAASSVPLDLLPRQ